MKPRHKTAVWWKITVVRWKQSPTNIWNVQCILSSPSNLVLVFRLLLLRSFSVEVENWRNNGVLSIYNQYPDSSHRRSVKFCLSCVNFCVQISERDFFSDPLFYLKSTIRDTWNICRKESIWNCYPPVHSLKRIVLDWLWTGVTAGGWCLFRRFFSDD